MNNPRVVSLFWALIAATLIFPYCSDRSPMSPEVERSAELEGNGVLTLNVQLSKAASPSLDRIVVTAKQGSAEERSVSIYPSDIKDGEATVSLKVPAGTGWVVTAEAHTGDLVSYRGASNPLEVTGGKSVPVQIALRSTRDLEAGEVFLMRPGEIEAIDLNSVVEGNEVDLTVRSRNTGSVRATGWRFEVYLDGAFIAYLNDVSIDAGGAKLLWYTWVAEAGTHTVAFRLDTENVIGENNETDNTASLTFTVRPRVDLIAEEVYITWPGETEAIDPNTLVEGDEVYLYVRVRNTATVDVTGWGSVSYIDGVQYMSGRDHSVGAHSTHLIYAPWTAVAGTHTVAFSIDPEDVIAEADENNNTVSLTFTVSGGAGQDTDRDGFPDSEDLVPQGNAQIQVTLDRLIVFGRDELAEGPLRLEIYFDIYYWDELSGLWQFVLSAPNETDYWLCDEGTTYALDWVRTLDVPDNLRYHWIAIQMWDSDEWNEDDPYDLDGSGTALDLMLQYDLETGALTGDEVDGVADGTEDSISDENDGYLTYEIKTVVE